RTSAYLFENSAPYRRVSARAGAKKPRASPKIVLSPRTGDNRRRKRRRKEKIFLALHPYPGLIVVHESIEMFFDLRDAEDFFDGGLAVADFVPAVGSKAAHAELHGFGGDGGSGSAVEDQRAKAFVKDQQFINSHSALVTELAAVLAADATPEF